MIATILIMAHIKKEKEEKMLPFSRRNVKSLKIISEVFVRS